mmetsp:Transcript_49918/g.91332  ORF Transcript_49918/g.91332 Transcript_49918/m.91332 type:complete len:134 (-) Transcript_49918:264-665(-)
MIVSVRRILSWFVCEGFVAKGVIGRSRVVPRRTSELFPSMPEERSHCQLAGAVARRSVSVGNCAEVGWNVTATWEDLPRTSYGNKSASDTPKNRGCVSAVYNENGCGNARLPSAPRRGLLGMPSQSEYKEVVS